jgi:hypothetical protein
MWVQSVAGTRLCKDLVSRLAAGSMNTFGDSCKRRDQYCFSWIAFRPGDICGSLVEYLANTYLVSTGIETRLLD